MASDSWLPHQFRNLSVLLVRQNGVIFIGGCALAILAFAFSRIGRAVRVLRPVQVSASALLVFAMVWFFLRLRG